MSAHITPPPVDVVTLLITVVTALLGPDVARMVGPYIVIVFGAMLGSAWSASRRNTETLRAAGTHMLRHVGLALLITVPSAAALGEWLGWDHKWLLGPVAALIGGIGHDWPRVGAWLLGLVGRGIEALVQRRTGAEPPKGDGQ